MDHIVLFVKADVSINRTSLSLLSSDEGMFWPSVTPRFTGSMFFQSALHLLLRVCNHKYGLQLFGCVKFSIRIYIVLGDALTLAYGSNCPLTFVYISAYARSLDFLAFV
ncbi:hypothetical protein KCU89_g85, partial [Aureobasidium melanogenum]